MKKLQPTTQFRKDIKKYRNNPKKLESLKEVLSILQEGKSLPSHYYPHPLHGNYKGCMECHIQGDFLLIWLDEDNDIIELVRLGTYSELFDK